MANDLNIELGMEKATEQIKNLTKSVKSLGGAFSSMQDAIPKNLGKRFSNINENLLPIAKTLDKLGSGFKNISKYADSAKTSLNSLSANKSLAKTVRELNVSLSGVNTNNINETGASLGRLGRSFQNLALYSDSSQLSLNRLINGFVTNRTKISSFASNVDTLVTQLYVLTEDTLKDAENVDKFVNTFYRLSVSLRTVAKYGVQAQQVLKEMVTGSFGNKTQSIAASITAMVTQFNQLGEGFSNSNFIKAVQALAKFKTAISFKDSDKISSAYKKVMLSIVNSINRLSKVAQTASFTYFERLAESVWKLATGSKALRTATEKADATIRQYKETVEGATRATNWLAGGWKSVVSAFAGGTIIYSVVRYIKDAIFTFIEFERRMRLVNTMARLNEEALSSLSNQVLDTAAAFGMGQKEAAEAMFAITSATYKGADAMRVFRSASMLAVAGDAELRASSELLSRTLQAYGKSTTEAEHISDVLFKTQERGILTISELNSDLGKTLGSAVAASVSFEELNAAIATLTTRGLKTTMATTAMNSLLLKLAAGTAKLDALFRQLGYDSTATALKMQGLGYVMKQLELATGGTSEELQRLGFNSRDIRAAAILANDVGGMFAKNLEEIADGANTAGKTLQAFSEVQKSLSQQLRELGSSIQSAVVQLSTFVSNTFIKDIVGLLNSFVKVKAGFDSFLGTIKLILKYAIGAVAVVGSIGVPLIFVVGAVAKLSRWLKALNLLAFSSQVRTATKSLGIFGTGITTTITGVKSLRVALLGLQTSFLPLLAITVAVTTLEYAWRKAGEAFKEYKTETYLDKSGKDIEALAKGLEHLSSNEAIENRLNNINDALEKLSTLTQTAGVSKLTKDLQKATEQLNKMKERADDATDSFTAMQEYRKKVEEISAQNRGDRATVLYLKEREAMLKNELTYVKKGSQAWVELKSKLLDVNSELIKYNKLIEDGDKRSIDAIRGVKSFTSGVSSTEQNLLYQFLDATQKVAKYSKAVYGLTGIVSPTSPYNIIKKVQRGASAESINASFSTSLAKSMSDIANKTDTSKLKEVIVSDLRAMGLSSLSGIKLSDSTATKIGELLVSINKSAKAIDSISKASDISDAEKQLEVASYNAKILQEQYQLARTIIQSTSYATEEQRNEVKLLQERVQLADAEKKAIAERLKQIAILKNAEKESSKTAANFAELFKLTSIVDPTSMATGGYKNMAKGLSSFLGSIGLTDYMEESKGFRSLISNFENDAKQYMTRALPIIGKYTAESQEELLKRTALGIDTKEYETYMNNLNEASIAIAKYYAESLNKLRKESPAKIFESFGAKMFSDYSKVFVNLRKETGRNVVELNRMVSDVDKLILTTAPSKIAEALDIYLQRASKGLSDVEQAKLMAFFPKVAESRLDYLTNRNKFKTEIENSVLGAFGTLGNIGMQRSILKKQEEQLTLNLRRARSMGNEGLGLQFSSLLQLADNLSKQKGLLSQTPGISAVPVSEQVSVGTRTAYEMFAKQKSEQYQAKLVNNTDTIASKATQIAKDISAVYKVLESGSYVMAN